MTLPVNPPPSSSGTNNRTLHSTRRVASDGEMAISVQKLRNRPETQDTGPAKDYPWPRSEPHQIEEEGWDVESELEETADRLLICNFESELVAAGRGLPQYSSRRAWFDGF